MRAVQLLFLAGALNAAALFVSPQGSDTAPGTNAQPLRTFAAAQRAARRTHATTVHFHPGTYYLPETVVFSEADSGTAKAPVRYIADPGGQVVLSGGIRLNLHWSPYRDGILQAKVPTGFQTDQLFVNGERQTMARYPNFDPRAQYFNGWAADSFSKERAARWANPKGGFLHAMHRHLWGDFHFEITGKSADGELTRIGGWQNNRRLGIHDKYRFVENIFEELDAPGEWFLNSGTSTLYFYPPAGFNAASAVVEGVVLRHLVEFRGSQAKPVRHLTLDGFTFRHAARTFMDNREPLLRSDWTIYRGGAVFLTGTEDVRIENSAFQQLGGNAIFVSNYNRRVTIRACHIQGAGANGIAFVGDPAAVRSPLFFGGAKETQPISAIDRTPGPLTANYPAGSLVEDCLIHETGRVEKQTAPVQISMSESITIRHCSIYDVPRAGINISEGTWGGHVIEFCDVFDTVKETGDHGSFNSWGRDRFWGLEGIDLNALLTPQDRALPLLDARNTTVLRNNRWRCDHGWDIDLDDGSSNYEIINNLCLRGGLKLREGFQRRVENNIIVGNSFHPHVWYKGSGDVFRANIVFTPYKPIRVDPPWGGQVDLNLLHTPGLREPSPAAVLQKQSGRDDHSIAAGARFRDPARGDYSVEADSPAIPLGFRNFPMDRFGVQAPALKALARTPELPVAQEALAATLRSERDGTPWTWLGASVRNVIGMGEVSAAGLPGETGVLVLDLLDTSEAFRMGLRRADVVLSVDGATVDSLATLQRLWSNRGTPSPPALRITRGQQELTLGPFPGKRSDWNGYPRFDFEFADRTVTVVVPAKVAAGRPWLWRGEFFGAFATVDQALLKLGWHIVYMACPNTFGSPDTMARWGTLYEELTSHYGFSRRPVLLGMSRGGLYVYHWAAAHPDKTGLIYGDAPVCDVKSWPAGLGKGKGSPAEWQRFQQVYGLTEPQARAWDQNPIDLLAPIAQAGIPIIHVAGDADDIVPYNENTLVLQTRYEALGGRMKVIATPGAGHHPHSLEDPSPIIDFILSNRLKAPQE